MFPRSISNFLRFRALFFVKRARFLVWEENWDKDWFTSIWWNMADTAAGAFENCGKMTSCFGTRPGSKGPLSFSETFLCFMVIRYKMEGREAAKHRDEDHVS